MTNPLLSALLLAGTVALAVSANAQVFVTSHTNIETTPQGRFLIPACQTLMKGTTSVVYPNAEVVCTLNQNGVAIQTLPAAAGNPSAFSSADVLNGKPVVEGADYEATAEHDLIFQQVANPCTQNGVLVTCYDDPQSYGLPAGFPVPANRQFQDSGTISPGTVESFWTSTNGSNVFVIATSAETQFQSAQVLPFVWHTRVDDQPKQFNLNGNQDANWIFTGSSGTTSPVAPSQGIFITFTPPHPPLPVQQVDTLQGCKVDESHGVDCNSAQIIVEVLGVTIPPSNWDLEPPTNPDELLGGAKVKYNAITTQGGRDVPFTVTWAKTAETSGGNFVTVDPDGTVTVQPQNAFQGNDFTVDIQATNPIDPTVAQSGIFPIHIPTVSVKLTTTPFPGLNEPPFEARENRPFRFVATVTGPQQADNRLVTWGQKVLTFLGNPGSFAFPLPDGDTTDYTMPSGTPLTQAVTVTISACVGGHVDAFGDLQDEICDTFPLSLVPPVNPTSPPQKINSGESTPVTITGTGFGAAPTFTFSDPTVSFTLGTFSGPDANGVTTVTGTMTAVPIAVSVAIPVTMTSSLPPPSTPVTQNVVVRKVTTTAAVIPANPTLMVSQTQQFTPSLGCLTFGGQTCTVSQTATCSLISGPGTMSAGCLYTAPASLAAQTPVQAQACFTFGNVCTAFSMNLAPITVAVSPGSAMLGRGQSQQFQATVTNALNNNQGVTWSISPSVGTITAAGLYTAPAVISTTQPITVTACSVADTTKCSSVTITLVLFDGTLQTWTTDFSDSQGWDFAQYGTTMMFADLNGDGKMDVCGRGGAGILCALSNGTSFGPVFLALNQFSDAQGWNQVPYYGSLRLADVNGDGKPDVCGRGTAGILCALGNGTGTFGALQTWTTDFSDSQGWDFAQYGTTMMFADLNGDGKMDVCGRGGAGILCALSNGTNFGPVFLALNQFSDAQGWNQVPYYGSLRLADVNGDGKPDVCGRGPAGILCALGNGDGTFGVLQTWTTDFSDSQGWNFAQYGTTMMFADLNGDGKMDVCGRGGAGILCALSNGTSFGPIFPALNQFSDTQSWNQVPYYGSLRLADVNGDRKPDVCGRGIAGILCVVGK